MHVWIALATSNILVGQKSTLLLPFCLIINTSLTPLHSGDFFAAQCCLLESTLAQLVCRLIAKHLGGGRSIPFIDAAIVNRQPTVWDLAS